MTRALHTKYFYKLENYCIVLNIAHKSHGSPLSILLLEELEKRIVFKRGNPGDSQNSNSLEMRPK